jgi:aminodeoxyfutalosine synthase
MLYGHVETPAERVKHLIKLRELQKESLDAMRETERRRDEETKCAEDSTSSLRLSVSSSLHACFNCIIPLSFIPEQSELGNLPGPTGLTDLKTLAIARLMVQNIPHIKAFWIMQGIHLAQLALDWGCDDLDGTVVWYDITKRAGSTHQELDVANMKRLIREAGREPVERDTLYRQITKPPMTAGIA